MLQKLAQTVSDYGRRPRAALRARKAQNRLIQDDASAFDAILGKKLAVVEEFDLTGRRDALSLRLTYDAIERGNSMRMVSHHRIGANWGGKQSASAGTRIAGGRLPKSKLLSRHADVQTRVGLFGLIPLIDGRQIMRDIYGHRRFATPSQGLASLAKQSAQPCMSERIASARSGAAPG
jgi:hypothetical protein